MIEAIGEVELADGVHHGEGERDEHAARQQRTGILGSPGEEQRDAEPGDRVDQERREERGGRGAEAEGLPDPADENGDHAYGADKARDGAHRAEPRAVARRQPPCGRACRIQHSAQRPPGDQDPPQAEQYRQPAGEPGLVKGRADLPRQATGDPGRPVRRTRIDNIGGEAGQPDRQEQQGEEEQEQPERERAAHHRSRRPAVPPEGPQHDVDNGEALVACQPPLDGRHIAPGHRGESREARTVSGVPGRVIAAVIRRRAGMCPIGAAWLSATHGHELTWAPWRTSKL